MIWYNILRIESVNMKKNKIILKHCPNFYKIINYDIEAEDNISIKLINIYKRYIFSIDIDSPDDLMQVEKFDYVLNKYLEDYFFRKDMKNRLLKFRIKKNSNDFIKSIVEGIINAFDDFETGYTRNIYFARWI